jgi:hypothetical protein
VGYTTQQSVYEVSSTEISFQECMFGVVVYCFKPSHQEVTTGTYSSHKYSLVTTWSEVENAAGCIPQVIPTTDIPVLLEEYMDYCTFTLSPSIKAIPEVDMYWQHSRY